MIEEIPAQGSLPVWRSDEDSGALALRITEHGRAAIGADQGGEAGAAEAHQRAKANPAQLRGAPEHDVAGRVVLLRHVRRRRA